MHKLKEIIDKLKKAGAEIKEISPIHDSIVIGIDYSEMESKVVAMLLEKTEKGICLKELFTPFEEPQTPFGEMIRFCEIYGCTVDNIGDLINGDDPFIQEMCKKHHPEMKEWYNKHFQKPCGEILLGEVMKCLPPPTKEEIEKIAASIEGVRTGRVSSTKENKSNSLKEE